MALALPRRGQSSTIDAMRVPSTAVSLALVAALAGPVVAPGLAPAQVPGLPGSLTRPPDPIDRARSLSTAPRPALGPAPQPAERVVPERRVTVPGSAQQIVIPAHTERVLSNTQVEVPTLPVYGSTGALPPGVPSHIYRREAPAADARQVP
jgi:hypothetical protein